MGCFCCPVLNRRSITLPNFKKVILLVLGLDNAGKSTVISRLTKSSLDDVLPTVGFAVSDLHYKGCNVTFYDVGGGPKIRAIWKQYYADAHGIIFVVDASDKERMDECREILSAVLQNPKISRKPLLLLANKQDVPGALDEIDVVDRLRLETLVNQQKCPTLVELCAARVSPEKKDLGIKHGFKWLLRNISKDYPILNNRVLVDMASQDKEEREAFNRKKCRVEEGAHSSHTEIEVTDSTQPQPFKPLSQIMVEPKDSQHNFKPRLPPIEIKEEEDDEDIPESRPNNIELFFRSSDWSSTAELLTDVSTSRMPNWFNRPKSSGAIEFPVKKRKKRKKRLRLRKPNNRTAPAPMVDFSQPSRPIPAIFDPSYTTDVTVFQTENVVQTGGPKPLQNGPQNDVQKILDTQEHVIPTSAGRSTEEDEILSPRTSNNNRIKKSTKFDARNGKSHIPVPVKNGLKKGHVESNEILLDVQNLSL